MLTPGNSYDEVVRTFQWRIPETYNIGVDICDKWADDASRVALIHEDADGKVSRFTFRQLMRLSNRLANALAAHGLEHTDRFGILLPQCPETAVAHIAVSKIGAVAIPLFTLFGTDALAYRLQDSGARGIITDAANLEKILSIRDQLPALEIVIVTDGSAPDGVLVYDRLLEDASDTFTPAATLADDPALIIYTSGTTGPPKGALHAHRTLLGHLPGVEFPHEFFPRPGDLFWTPADWAWIGGLIDVLFPSWHHGIPVLAHRFRKFDPEKAFDLIARHGVRNAFMPPTALKLMRQVETPGARYDFSMRSIGSGGETLGEELLEWGRGTMGLTINEFYGQTECNLVVGSCAGIMEPRPGSMGRAIPGHVVEVIDSDGRVVPPGTVGEIAIKRPDPVMFLEYWNNPEATKSKFIDDWLLTGDTARKDEDGYFWFNGRTDDVITSAGYRIGPAEIEECLMKHPATAMAAVVGVPDEVRTEVVKAYIVARPGTETDEELITDIQAFVRERLAAHEYPRLIEFIDEMPMTATGKIMRRELKAYHASSTDGDA